MGKKTCWMVIFLALAVNVIMLQRTVEAYFGLEYEKVYAFTLIACLSVIVTFVAVFRWKNLEYKERK
jgi:hypothetical protein